MNLYLLTQDEARGYDTYDSAVVAAETEEDARKIHPRAWCRDELTGEWWRKPRIPDVWARHPDRVKAILIGVAVEGTEAGEVICASYNAG